MPCFGFHLLSELADFLTLNFVLLREVLPVVLGILEWPP